MQTSAFRSIRSEEPHDLQCEDILSMISPEQPWMLLLLIEGRFATAKLLEAILNSF